MARWLLICRGPLSFFVTPAHCVLVLLFYLHATLAAGTLFLHVVWGINLRSLNKLSIRIFSTLVKGLEEVGDSKRIAANDTFMAVVVECIGQHAEGRVFSVAHYGEEAGDAMRDPDVTFLVGENGKVHPLTFRNDYFGAEEVAVELHADGKLRVDEQVMYVLVDFCNGWMKSINEQQELGIV